MKKLWRRIGILALAVVFNGAAVLPLFLASADGPDAYDRIREKWVFMLTGGNAYDLHDPNVAEKIAAIDAETKPLLDTFNSHPDAEHLYLWPDKDWTPLKDVDTGVGSGGSANSPVRLYAIQTHDSYLRLKTMALAYQTYGSEYYRDAGLLEAILFGLEWMYDNWCNPTKKWTSHDWFYWEISIPQNLGLTSLLLHDEMRAASQANVDKYMAMINAFCKNAISTSGMYIGANRMWRVNVIAAAAAITKTPAKLEHARDAVATLLSYVTDSDGFYADGSFLQHYNTAYNGGYGSSLMKSMADMIYLLSDTPFEVNDPKISNIFEWVEKSFEPFLYKGEMMDMTRGREISRKDSASRKTGMSITRAIIQVSQFAPEPYKSKFRSLAKYMIQSGGVANYNKAASLDMIVTGQEILADDTVVPRSNYEIFQNSAVMARAVQHTDNYAFGISMISPKIITYESMSNENLRAWHTGFGMTYLYNDDPGQFNDNFWPTVDPYRLPGTTVYKKRSGSGSGIKNVQPWVGGTDMRGVYGAIGMFMELPATQTALTAKKSWFMFDDEIVAVGTDVKTKSSNTTLLGTDLETIVENRMVTDANILTTSTGASVGSAETALPGLSWAHLSGGTNGSAADIGYYFPGGASLNGLRESRTGSWHDINSNPSRDDTTPHTRDYMALWFNHGKGSAPANPNYSYVLLPDKSAAQTTAYSENPNVEILAQTSDVHAVREKNLKVTGMNFWNAGQVSDAGGFFAAVNAPASVMTEESGGVLEVSVSDPTMLNAGYIGLEIAREGAGVLGALDPRITVLQTSPTIKLVAATEGLQGAALKVKFTLGTPGGTPAAPSVVSDNRLALKTADAVTFLVRAPGASTFTLEGAPAGVTLDNFGVMTIAAEVSTGDYSFKIKAANSAGTGEQTFSLSVRRSQIVAHFRFDEGEGTTFSDSTGVSRSTNLNNTNIVGWGEAGYDGAGSCLVFNGRSGIAGIRHAGSADLGFTDKIEAEFRVNFTDSPHDRAQTILEKRPSAGGVSPYAVRVGTDGRIGLFWAGVWHESEPMTWDTEQWYHVYVIHDGGKIVFKRDGVRCGTVINKDTTGTASENLNISSGTSALSFVGKFDELILAIPQESDSVSITSRNSWLLPVSGGTRTYTVTSAGGLGAVTYALEGAPAGVSVNASTGVMTVAAGIPAGEYRFKVLADDGDMGLDVQNFTLEIMAAEKVDRTMVYWKLDEGTGKTMYNARHNQGSNRAGTIPASGVSWTAGRDGGTALEFTANQQTLLAHSLLLSSTGNPTFFTLDGGQEAVFYFNFAARPDGKTPNDDATYIFYRKDGYRLQVSNGKLGFRWNGELYESEKLDWELGKWYKIRVVKMEQAVDADNTIWFERDDVIVGRATGAASRAAATSGSGSFILSHTDAASCLYGKMDDFWAGQAPGTFVPIRKITYNTSGGTELTSSYVYDGNASARPADPQKSGETFRGWYKDSAFTQSYDFQTPVTGDITLYAKFAGEADYSAVDAAIARIPADLSLYTSDSVATLNAAKNAVVRGKDSSEQAVVDGWAQAIENAITALVYKNADYSAVNAAIAKIPADLSVYTSETVATLNAAKNAVVTGKNITEQAAVDGWAQAIESAITALVYKNADYSAVNAAIAKIPADLSVYTSETVATLNAAKNAVVTGKNITEQAAVDGWAQAIENAITALAYKGADYSAVNAAIAKIPADLSVYTDETVAALNAAKNAVVTGKNITEQAAVDGWAQAIESAITALAKKSTDPGPADPEPSNPETDPGPADPEPSNPATDPGSTPTVPDNPDSGDQRPALLGGTLALMFGAAMAVVSGKRRKISRGRIEP